MGEIIEAFFNCLPGIILVVGIAVYQVIEDRAARKSFERERERWTYEDSHAERLRGEGDGDEA